MRWTKTYKNQSEVKGIGSGFLYLPETLPVGSKDGISETRWLEYATWRERVKWLSGGKTIVEKQYWIDNMDEGDE